MTHASLFSGIGGFDLAAQWMGWENVFQVEIDPFCTKVLEKNFPNTKRYGDIKEFDGTKYRGTIDILTGGFPCQPFSATGKRKGTADDRHLWPEMLRIIGEIHPTYIVGENVRGLLNWSGGVVFDQVQADMETKGYTVAPFLLPACSLDAPHRRDRIWFVAADTESMGRRRRRSEEIGSNREINLREGFSYLKRFSEGWITTNSNSHKRCEGGMYKAQQEPTKRYAGSLNTRNGRQSWQDFPNSIPRL